MLPRLLFPIRGFLRTLRYGPSLIVNTHPGTTLTIAGVLKKGYPRTHISLTDDSSMYVGENAFISNDCDIAVIRGGSFSLGSDSYICPGAFIRCAKSITIGKGCAIGRSLEIRDIDGPWHSDDIDIEINDNVWIGDRVIILKGTVIGSGSIVGAGAVVAKGYYPPNSLIVGNPAIVKKTGVQWKPRNRHFLEFTPASTQKSTDQHAGDESNAV